MFASCVRRLGSRCRPPGHRPRLPDSPAPSLRPTRYPAARHRHPHSAFQPVRQLRVVPRRRVRLRGCRRNGLQRRRSADQRSRHRGGLSSPPPQASWRSRRTTPRYVRTHLHRAGHHPGHHGLPVSSATSTRVSGSARTLSAAATRLRSRGFSHRRRDRLPRPAHQHHRPGRHANAHRLPPQHRPGPAHRLRHLLATAGSPRCGRRLVRRLLPQRPQRQHQSDHRAKEDLHGKQETKDLDNIIASRRAMLLGGGAALAAMAMPKTAQRSGHGHHLHRHGHPQLRPQP